VVAGPCLDTAGIAGLPDPGDGSAVWAPLWNRPGAGSVTGAVARTGARPGSSGDRSLCDSSEPVPEYIEQFAGSFFI
jgi:hypothetical protein